MSNKRIPLGDVTNRATVDEGEQVKDAEQQRKEKRARYMHDYRARKKAEANMVSLPQNVPSSANSVLSEIRMSVALAQQQSGRPRQKKRRADMTPEQVAESNRKQAEYRERKKAESYILSPNTGLNTQLGTGVSTILDVEHIPANENIDPNETNDWLHRNDNYMRSRNHMGSCSPANPGWKLSKD